MITRILENLKTKEVISENKVDNLRSYIRGKYPQYDAKEMSAIFADAINKIIDSNIDGFDEGYKRGIRDGILRKAVSKNQFSIYGDDVLASCLLLGKDDARYVDKLTAWVNRNQELEVSRERFNEFVEKARQYEAAVLLEQLNSIAGEIENSLQDMNPDISRRPEKTAPVQDTRRIVQDKAETQWIEAISDLLEGKTKESSDPVINEAALEAIKEVEANEAALVLAEVYSLPDDGGYPDEKFAVEVAHEIFSDFNTFMRKAKYLLQREYKDLVHYLKYEARLSRLAFRAAVVLVVIAAGMFILQRSYGSSTYVSDFFIAPVSCVDISEDQVDRYLDLDSKIKYKLNKSETLLIVKSLKDGLHEELRYTEIDRKALKKWLNGKNSLLAEEPYFSAIIDTAKRYDIHPFLLFAITGQEQAFVPKNNDYAKKIANNPFNVYGSWQDYNTNIYDASELAANVIVKSSKGRPVYINAIKWINRRYAEDENWWKSVASIFSKMKNEIN